MKEPLNPWTYPAVFALAALLGFAGLPENAAAAALCAFFAAAALKNPLNGIYFIILAVPFFLSDSKRPFYLLLEFFAFAALLAAAAHFFMKRPRIKFTALMLPALIMTAVSFLSVPLNLKEIIWDMRMWPAADILGSIASSHEGSNFYYFRTLFNSLSAVMLFFAAAAFIRDEKDAVKIFKPALFILLANAAAAFALFYRPAGGSYLSLSLAGRHDIGTGGPGMTAFAYNRGYLAQYLSVFSPVAVYFIMDYRKHRAGAAAAAALLAVVFMVVFSTLQRVSAVVIGGQVLLLGLLLSRIKPSPGRTAATVLGALAALAGIFFITDLALLGGRAAARISSLASDRTDLWRVAWEMFARNPLLGVGHGRFLLSFEKYCGYTPVSFDAVQFSRTTAHNLYLHTLAENGIAGLGALLFTAGAVFSAVFRHIRHVDREKQKVLTVLCLSLCGSLLYGLTQHIFYVRSLQMMFWLNIAFIAAILRDRLPALRPGRRAWTAALAIFALMLFYRIFSAAVYPYPDNFYSGFYRAEAQRDGRQARWIGHRAARRIPPGKGGLVFGLKCPTPSVSSRPQTVRITSGGFETKIVLSSTGYREAVIPAEHIREDFTWVFFETSYTAVPAGEGWSDDTRRLGVMVFEPVWRGE